MNKPMSSRAAVLAVLVGLAGAGLWLAVPVGAQVGGFSDVGEDLYFSRAVGDLAAWGVLVGTACDEGFCPDEVIDRQTVAVWVVRMRDGGDPSPVSSSRFGDVDAGDFYGPFIERMAELGVTSGCGDGAHFCPHGSVTRAQMAAFLSRAYNLADGPDPGFADVAADAWYAADVARLAGSGITRGCGDGILFCPDQPTTRAQTAAFLWRAEDRFGRGSEQPGDAADGRSDIDNVTVEVYLCAREDTFDDADLAAEVQLLNDHAVPWFESQFGDSGASIRFAAGGVLHVAAAEWEGRARSMKSLWQAEHDGDDVPCRKASLPEGASERTALIVADLSVGGGTHGFARQGAGPAWVGYRKNFVGKPHGFDRDPYWIAAAAHEISHSVYDLKHPWREWNPEASDSCEAAPAAARGDATRERELESLMSWPPAWCGGIYDLRPGKGAFLACRHRLELGWIAPDACDGPVDPSRVPGTPTLTAVVPGDGSLRLEWSAPTGPEEVTDYDVSYRPAGTDSWTEWRPADVSTRLSATITGLTNGVRYEVAVWAHNEHAGSPYSSPMSGTPQAPGTDTRPQPEPDPSATVTLSVGSSAQGVVDEGRVRCRSVNCRWLRIDAQALGPGPYAVECWHEAFDMFGRALPRAAFETDTVDELPTEDVCFFGFPDVRVWAVVNGVKSNEVTWPHG